MTRAWRLLPLLVLTSCGGGSSARPATAPAESGGAPAPTTLEEAAPKAEPTLEPLDVRIGREQASFDEASTAFAAAGSDCMQLCKALGSMAHATERLCELTKDSGDDARCSLARTKLDDARAKVKASCGGCG